MTITKEGAIASFYTINKAPIKHLKVYFSPKQAGEGTPSSENIRPIEGWDQFTLSCSNKGLVKFGGVGPFASYFNGYNDQWIKYNTTTVPIVDRSSYYTYSCYIDNTNGTETSQVQVWFKDITNTKYLHVSPGNGIAVGTAGWSKVTFKPSSTDFFLGLGVSLKPGAIASKGTLELGSTMTEYEPYQGFTQVINWSNDAGVIYGGYIDLITGELVSQYGFFSTTWGAGLNNTVLGANERRGFYSSSVIFDTASNLHANGQGPYQTAKTTMCNAAFWAWDYNSDTTHYYINERDINVMLPIGTDNDLILNFCAKLKNPQTVAVLTPLELQTFLGSNNIWSNADRVEVEYDLAESNDELYRRRNIILQGAPHLENASGAIASFNTDMKAPLKELKAHFTPVQEGTGDPSLQNIRPIHGWTKLSVHDEGKNLIDKNSLVGTDKVWWKGKVIGGYPNHYATPMIPVKPGGTYYLNRDSGSQDYVCFFDKDGEYIEQQVWNTYAKTKTLGDNVYYIGVTIKPDDINTALLQFDSTNTNYVNYIQGSIIPVQFPVMKNLVALNYSPYSAQQNPSVTIVKQTIDELEFTTHGDYTYECVRLFYVIPAGTYTAKIYATTIDENDNYSPLLAFYASGERTPFAGIRNGQTVTFTLAENTVVDMRFFGNLDDSSQRTVRFSKFQIERGSVATDYESRATIYGGYVDLVRNKLVATHVYMERAITDMDNTDSYPGWTNSAPVSWFGEINKAVNAYTNISTYGGWKIGVNNRYHDPGVLFLVYDHFGLTQTEWKENYPNLIVQFVLELANPIEYDITPQQIKTLKGTNNIWSDANGNIEVKYWTH